MNELTQLVENNKLKPVLNKVFPLSEMAKAHRLLETKGDDANFYGKIGIDMA
jgi:NADPH:quinone reductase-like Zn-dependent oxidoreductase